MSFRAAGLGYAGDIYVYDVNRASGRLTAAAATYDTTNKRFTVPVSPAGGAATLTFKL